MDFKSGKTFRNIDKGKKRDSSFVVRTKESDGCDIEIMGFDFHPGLPYSMKKKQRWQLAAKISNVSYNEETPILYSKHQCVQDDWPLLDSYLYDSLTNTTLGTLDVSNRRLEKGRFNIRSAINQIENRYCYTRKEKKSYEKSNMKFNKVSGNSKDVYDANSELPPREDSLLNKELRRDCIYVHEFIHVNDLSRVNMVKPYRYKYWGNSNVRQKTVIDKHLFNDSESDNDEIAEESIYLEESAKPFVITGNDFICRNKEISYKVRKSKQKKNGSSSKCFYNEQEMNFDENSTKEEYKVVDVYDDSLPTVVINLSRDQFITSLTSILSFCKCWQCSASPLTILVDMDEYEESKEKSFILLRPVLQIDEDMVSVKVLLNVFNDGFHVNEVLDGDFNNLEFLVAFIQSKLRSGTGNKLSIVPKLIQLGGSVDEVLNLPTTINVENPHYLYLFHNEWKNCKLNINDIDRIMIDLNATLNYCMDECILCKCEVPDDATIVIDKCQHRVCESCLCPYIGNELDSYKETIVCPCSDCSISLDGPTILSLISWKHYRLRLTILESAIVSRCGHPCSMCASVLLLDDDVLASNKVQEYVCLCGKSVCRACGELQHYPSSCQEMNKHSIAIAQIEDKEYSLKSQQIKCSKTFSCSQCQKFINRFQTKPYTCACYKVFCYACRSSYKSHMIECEKLYEEKYTFHKFVTIVPFQEAKSPAMKLYNQSVFLRMLLRKSNLTRFKNDHVEIVSSSMVTRTQPYSTDEVTRIYSQALRVLEAIYVSAYNNLRRDDPERCRRLRLCTDQLLFYVGRIRMLTEEISDLLNGRSGLTINKEVVRQKYARLERYIEDARLYARKTLALVKPRANN